KRLAPERARDRSHELDQLGAELGGTHHRGALRVEQLGTIAEPRRRPAVLDVVGAAAVGEPGRCCRKATVERGGAERLDERGERRGEVDVGRLVENAYLERAELRVRTDVPPDPGVIREDAQA